MKEAQHFVIIVGDAMAVGPFRSRASAEGYVTIHKYQSWRIMLVIAPTLAVSTNVENDH